MAHRQSAKTFNNIVHRVEDPREPGEVSLRYLKKQDLLAPAHEITRELKF